MSSNEQDGKRIVPFAPVEVNRDARAGEPAPPNDEARRPTYTEAFPLKEANEWIAAWKAADGGFYCHPQPDGSVMVQLAYQHEQDAEAIEEAIDRIQPLQDRLLRDPTLKSAVCTLIADAWNFARQKPAGHA